MKTRLLKLLLFSLIVYMIVSATACMSTKTTVTHTRDTVFVHIHDTAYVKMGDTLAIEKENHSIDTVFQQVEKDCPNEQYKIPAFEKEIKEECTLESITGGSMTLYFPKLKQNITIKFYRNKAIAVDDGLQEEIDDKTEITKTVKKSLFGRIAEDFEIILVIIVALIIGYFAGWLRGKI